MNAIVRVYFHSSSKKYNRVECWGPLKDAAKVAQNYDNVIPNSLKLVCLYDPILIDQKRL